MISPPQEIFRGRSQPWDYTSTVRMRTNTLIWKIKRRFLRLKGALLPEIEIVQMNYITPPDFNTVQNCKKEPRPKLFKRLRTFSWVDPV